MSSEFTFTGRKRQHSNPLMALMPNWATAVAGVKAQTQDATLLFGGDSTYHGFDGVSSTVKERQSVVAKMVDHLVAAGYPAVNAMVKPRDFAKSSWREDRIAIAGVPFNANSSGFNAFAGGFGFSIQNTTTTTAMTITPGIPWDICDVYYIRGGGGTINAEATGGSAVQQATTGGVNPIPFWGIDKYTVTAATVDDANVLTINRVSGNCYWVAFVFRRSDIKQILLCNSSYPGASLELLDFNQTGFEQRSAYRDFPADLHAFICTINEAQAGRTVANVLGFANNHISRLHDTLGKDIVFISPFPSSTPAFIDLEMQYRDAIKARCQELNLPYIDFMAELYNDTWVADDFEDNLHPGDRGNRRGGAYLAPKFIP